jgi:MFS family permease
MMAPGLPQIAEHYTITNETIIAMTLSIFLLTFAIGPLFLAPMSEIYGRTWVCPMSLLSLRALTELSDIAHW